MNLLARAQHLTEDELDELLIAGPEDNAALHSHVASCKACTQRLAEFSTSLAVFNDATHRWSEARSNTFNRDLGPALAESQMRTHRWTRRVQWLGPITAAVLVAAVMMATPGSTSSLNPERTPVAAAPVTPAAPAVDRQQAAAPQLATKTAARPALTETAALSAPAERSSYAAAPEPHHAHDTRELASDNAILLAIDSAIDPQEPTPDEFYRSTGGAAGPLNKAVTSQVSD